MKTTYLAAVLWLAASSGAWAQFTHTGPSSPSELYGAGPSTPPQMFQKQPPVAPVTANTAANGTANGTGSPTAPTVSGDSTMPGAAPSANMGAISSNPLAPDLANVVLPSSMALIDNQRVLAPRDQFVFQVMEDHDPPKLLFVDEKGEVAPEVPYLSQLRIKAEGATLRQLAANISEQLTNKSLGYYSKATVLLAPYRGDNSRGHVNIDGQVMKPGQVPVPASSVLTLWQALTAAGWFAPSADREHVQLIHNDLEDSSKSSRQEFNIQKDIDEGREEDVIVQPGDFIKVLSKTENNSVVTVTGEVRQQQVVPVSSSNPPKISDFMIQYGAFTDWSNHTVQLVRYKDGKRLPDQYINLDDIQVRGDQTKNIPLEPGDMIIVKANWWSFK